MVAQRASTEMVEMEVGDFLCRRIYEAGCDTIFAVPGDFCLGFLAQVLRSKCKYVGTCNELNAAYAADGYARHKGLGCVTTTYAVGELSGINGIAGAFAENVPVIAISGTPTTDHFKSRPLLHHTLGDYAIPQKMYSHVTAGQIHLSNPNTAVQDIDSIILLCLEVKRPVYISLPSDIASRKIMVPSEPLDLGKPKESNPEGLEEAMLEILSRLHLSTSPLLIPGVELARRGLSKTFEQFVNSSGIPYVTMMLCKAIIDEDNDLFVGLFNGNRSREQVQNTVSEADCILIFGEKMTDFNTGGFTAILDDRTTIHIGYDFVRVSHHTYHDVYIHDVLDELLRRPHKRSKPTSSNFLAAKRSCTIRGCEPFNAVEGANLTMARFFQRCASFMQPNGTVIAETGASLFSACETLMPAGTRFMGQTFYGSIGYSVGATLGACMAEPSRPTYLFVGDGSFQVTAQDLSTMIRYGCHPVVFLINNDGYTIERVIIDHPYNDIQMWKYAQLPAIFGGTAGTVVKTEDELEKALEVAQKEMSKRLVFIEVILDKFDCSELLKKAGEMMAKNNKLI